jgi:hypothetical protein
VEQSRVSQESKSPHQLAQKDTSSENQAHGRIYRIGQKKPTLFVTTIIEDTIDEGVVEREFSIQDALYVKGSSYLAVQEEKENNIGLVMKNLSQEQKARLLRRGSMCKGSRHRNAQGTNGIFSH